MEEIGAIIAKYNEDYLRVGLRSPADLRSFSSTFYGDVAEIFDAITRIRNIERNPSGFSINDAPILGLLVRMWKLLKEIVRYYREDNAETISLLDRIFLEAAVTAVYLMRCDSTAIEDYRKCSYRQRLRLLRAHREDSEFFKTKAGKRLLLSINEKLNAEGLTEADFIFQIRNGWRIGGKSFYDIFDEVYTANLYPATYGIMSESIHGSWNDSMDFSLVRNGDGTFSTFPFYKEADPRYVGPLILFAIPAYRTWLQRIEAEDDFLRQVLVWIERVNTKIFFKFDDYFDGP